MYCNFLLETRGKVETDLSGLCQKGVPCDIELSNGPSRLRNFEPFFTGRSKLSRVIGYVQNPVKIITIKYISIVGPPPRIAQLHFLNHYNTHTSQNIHALLHCIFHLSLFNSYNYKSVIFSQH